jgi:hypothetical protein
MPASATGNRGLTGRHGHCDGPYASADKQRFIRDTNEENDMESNLRRDFSSGTPGASSATRKRVVAPIERDGKTIWLRVGAAFLNKDSSWNLYIDAMPFNGRLQLRDWDEYDGRGRGGNGNGGEAVPGMSSLSLPAMGGAPDNENETRDGLPF